MTWRPTAAHIIRAIYGQYAAGGMARFALLTEVPTESTTGARYIDALLIKRGKGKPVDFERIAVEVKVTRGDFHRDTEHKRGAWRNLAHRFAYATPAGMIRRDEVPDGCGLLEVNERATAETGFTRVRWAVRAPTNPDPAPMPPYLMAYIAGRASRAEAALAGWDGNSDDSAVLARRLDETQRALEQQREKTLREQDKRKTAEKNLAALGDPVCATCGEPIRPRIHLPGLDGDWQHRRTDAEDACQRTRFAAAKEEARAFYDILPDDVKHTIGGQQPWTRHDQPWAALVNQMPVLPQTLVEAWREDMAVDRERTVGMYRSGPA